MRVTTKGRYALRAIIALSRMGAGGKPVSIKRLAEAEGISPEFLEQIFFSLRRSELIRSVRGPGGGFVLARKPSEISLKHILDASGEGLDISPCSCAKDAECGRRGSCQAQGVWDSLGRHMELYLTGMSLEDITRQD